MWWRYASSAPLVRVSEAMRRTVAEAARMAESQDALAVLGEGGAGKTRLVEWLATCVWSREGPVIWCSLPASKGEEACQRTILCGGALADGRYYRGLVRQAARGTLVFDHVDILAREAQEVAYELLCRGTYTPFQRPARTANVRLVFTTSQDLSALARSGQFLNGLADSISKRSITVPPLRERREDILPLLEKELREDAREQQQPAVPSLAETAREYLRAQT